GPCSGCTRASPPPSMGIAARVTPGRRSRWRSARVAQHGAARADLSRDRIAPSKMLPSVRGRAIWNVTLDGPIPQLPEGVAPRLYHGRMSRDAVSRLPPDGGPEH